MNIRNTIIAGVALSASAASADSRLHPVHNADGTIEVAGHVYPSTHAYLTSQAFRDSGGRCGVERRIVPSGLIAQSDCSFDATHINQEYNDDRTLVIQVVFHMITNTTGAGNVDDAHIQSQLQILNEDYQALANSHGAPGTNAKVKFVLARFDPQGHPSTGIDRVVNNTYFTEGDRGTSAMKTALHWDTSRYLNVYSNDLDSQGLLGYATFPQESAGDPDDGVVLAYQSVGLNPAYAPYDLGASATHEVGHYMGLFHTFQGPDNDNSDTAGCNGSGDGYHQGDLINDTVKEAAPNFGCDPAPSGCPGTDMSPIENYMDYSEDSCMTKFSVEQSNRVRCSIMNYRWIDTEPTASFTFTAAQLAVSFTAVATDAESQPTELHYNWDFGDGEMSTDQNPMHTYAAAGSYTVKLEVVDPNSAATTVTNEVVVQAGNGNGSGSGSGSNGGGGDDDGGDGSSGGGCCQAPKGGLSFALCSVPVAFGLMRRRRRR